MKKDKLPSLVSILILTLITSVVWVALNIYRSFAQKPALVVPENISRPLTPTLDQDTINAIESTLFLDTSQIPNEVASGGLLQQQRTPVPTLIPLPTATGSAVPTATPSGGI
jgi:hypothetical protein